MDGDDLSKARQYDGAKRNQFLAALTAQEFSLLSLDLRTVPLDRGTVLYDSGDDLD